MTAQDPLAVTFHPDAAARFNEVAQEILHSVESFGPTKPPAPAPVKLHPVVEIPSSDIIGEIKIERSADNRLGEEMGRYWDSQGLRVGWEGDKFDRIKQLAHRFSETSSLKGKVSEGFLLNEVFQWLRETLELKRNDTIADCIGKRCNEEIEEREIWIPVYRTFSAQDFTFGDVEFRTVSESMMDEWFSRLFPNGIAEPDAALAINRERSRIQGGIAARVRFKAERERAREIAHAAANEAVGLLRFLSHVNWTSRIVSYCAPLGREGVLQTEELFVKDGVIENLSKASVDQGQHGWNIDEARALVPGAFEALQNLAGNRHGTEFRRDLYDALQLHSRNSLVAAVSHKIVFVVAATESLLLKNSYEPIQKNLGERMAFLIGKSLASRKEIVKNVEEFYEIRSRLIHHGREASGKDLEVIDTFFFNAWWTFRQLLAEIDRYQTKAQMLSELEDRKLS
jgi:hypothetical protein